jgi:Kef-type K+ transport system membrane component KefB/voltage-gated potassium channel Kch
MAGEFVSISLILLIVLIVSFIMRILKQPLIIGYILSGILAGPLFFNLLSNGLSLSLFSELGIAFLLFIVGLHLSPNVIKEVGGISLITGLGQVLFTSVFGFLICLGLGFGIVPSIYIAIALTFSSTIIIMKLLSDKDALDTLFGKISIGFLLVQDLVAIIILIVVSSLSSGGNIYNLISSTFLKGILIFLLFIPINKYVFSRLGNLFGKSQELLFLFAVAFGLGMASLFYYAGFSIEVGALIAGILLSYTPYTYEIGSKLKPLRDFFIISFFIILGSQMVFSEISSLIIPAIVLSLFILIGNPLIVIVLMGIFGYSKKTGFMAGLTVAQISEFSLILVALGVKIGHLTNDILSFVTVIGLITIAGSTYMIMYSEFIYSKLSKYLNLFERKKTHKENIQKNNYEYILFGENRIGFSIMNCFKQLGRPYLIVDFNPGRVSKLCKQGINCIYGDVSEDDFFDELKFENTKLVVSTIPEFEANLMVLERIKRINPNIVVIVAGRHISEATKLYKLGADYVILPHFLGGEYVAKMINDALNNGNIVYEREKERQIADLKARLKEGQEHPDIKKENKGN